MLVRARNAFIGAGACVALLALNWVLAFHLGLAGRADRSILGEFSDIPKYGTVWRIASPITDICSPKPFVILALIPIAVALVRRRPRLAITAGAILLGASCTTQLLKSVLAEPRDPTPFGHPIGPGSWPSGHSTAAMSLALALVLVAPARLRPVVAALGAAFAIVLSYSLLTLGAHYPSDVLGGYLVAASWTLLCVGALRATQARERRPATKEGVSVAGAITPVVLTLLAAAAALVLIVIVRPHAVVSYAESHPAFVVGGAAIALVGAALSTGLVLALRR